MTSPSESESNIRIYMTMKDVLSYTRVKSKNTIYLWIDTRGFPKPTKVGRLVRWDMEEVAKWMVTGKQ